MPPDNKPCATTPLKVLCDQVLAANFLFKKFTFNKDALVSISLYL